MWTAGVSLIRILIRILNLSLIRIMTVHNLLHRTNVSTAFSVLVQKLVDLLNTVF